MKLSEIFIKNHVMAWMLLWGLIIFGAISFSRMGVSQLPDVDSPKVSVSIDLDGASPEEMEMDVVDVVEGALTSVPGIINMSSSAKLGSANVSVEFDLDKNINVAVQEIQNAMSRIQKKLPKDIDPPTVRKSNPEDQPILWLSVSSPKLSNLELMKIVRDQVQDSFSTIEGVGDVTLGGFVDPNLRVWLNQEKLQRYQLTASDVISAIGREHSQQPGGQLVTGDQELSVRTMGEAPTLEDFKNITITRRGGSTNYVPLALKDVAQIEDGTADIRSISRSQGQSSVGLGIKKQPGSNAVQVGRLVKERLKQVAAQLPPGVEINVRFDSTQFIEESVSELNFTLIFSALLTALVCWIFLGSWTATMNVILAIPTSVVGSFIVLYALHYTLNTFTLLGLSLAIGIVVDDAIMVLENIVRHNELGKTRWQAAVDGSREISTAALAATLAVIAIFMPVTFMNGVIGKYFLQFGITLSVAVAISLLEALTLTPMRCSRYLVVHKRTSYFGRAVESGFEGAAHIYSRMIPVTLKYPWLTLLFACAFFASTLGIGKLLKQEFIPAQDQSRLMVKLQTPAGTTLAVTNEKMKILEKILAARPEVAAYFSSVGGGADDANQGNVFLSLKPRNKRKMSAQEFAASMRKTLKKEVGAKVTIQDPSLAILSGGKGIPVQFKVHGPDWDKLTALTKQITEEMENTGLMMDIDTNQKEGQAEIAVVPDREQARKYGVDVSDISDTVRVMMAGEIAGKFSQHGRRYDVRVGLPLEKRNSREMIKKLQVRNNQGELISLDKVVKLKEQMGPQAISRENRQRAISVDANVAPGSSQKQAMKAVEEIAKKILPAGYSAEVVGSAKTFNESFSGLWFALLLGIVVSYMILASQFNSFIHPLTILLALPFSVSGAFIALYIGGQTLNIYSLIGLILLMGIVKKNSILLVDFTNHIREQGKSVDEALLEACPVRLRPILMTSMATIVGAIPPALAIGPGAETRVPMALAVIGGVIVSTLLTLLVVPAAYRLFSRLDKPLQH